MAAIHTRNILKVYRRASDKAIADGMSWYCEAHNLAMEYSPNDVWRGAGVIAAYSPLTPWWRNRELAIDSLTTGIARTDALGNSARAAQRILDGEPVTSVLKGDKTSAFAENIALNGVSDRPTVDVHAYSIAMGKPVPSSQISLGKKLYAEIAESYRRASAREDISPTQMQAITWVQWRDENVFLAARPELKIAG